MAEQEDKEDWVDFLALPMLEEEEMEGMVVMGVVEDMVEEVPEEYLM